MCKCEQHCQCGAAQLCHLKKDTSLRRNCPLWLCAQGISHALSEQHLTVVGALGFCHGGLGNERDEPCAVSFLYEKLSTLTAWAWPHVGP